MPGLGQDLQTGGRVVESVRMNKADLKVRLYVRSLYVREAGV
jgi:hypothetical protein